MTSIGRRCRGGNVYSRAILITQTLSEKLRKAGRRRQVSDEKSRRRRSIEVCKRLKICECFRYPFPTYNARQERLDGNNIKVAIARGLHLFPFRTEKLNLATPMILRKWKSR